MKGPPNRSLTYPGYKSKTRIFRLFFNAAGQASFDFNFLNTTAISIDSPVEFTSDSGVFLTGTNNVPEPASFAMTLIGAAGLGWFARSRGRRIV
ncbi:MAG: PEP-CTERM sorting domain-containing protein [Pirellulales bacterium]